MTENMQGSPPKKLYQKQVRAFASKAMDEKIGFFED